MISMSDRVAKELWGLSSIKWLGMDTTGSMGGFLLVGDEGSVLVVDSWIVMFSVSAVVEDVNPKRRWMISSFYGLVNNHQRSDFCGGILHGGDGMGLGV